MSNKIVETAFKKLLGNGRAFKTPRGFMDEFLDVVCSPIVEIKNKIINLKFSHFPTTNIDENDISNILNGEELFLIKDIEGKSLEERAANVEGQWSIFGGCQTYKQIELILQKKGLNVKVIENIPQNYNLYGKRLIGNGFLKTEKEKIDPIVIKNKKHTFIVQANDFLTDSEIETLISAVVKNKPGHNGVYYIPRFLRKKEIHHILTKNQMQKLKKSQYCDVRTKGKF